MYYTYAYLREDNTPYYIGKGKGKRAWWKHNRRANTPTDESKVILLKCNLSEEDALKHEAYMIAVLGRLDKGTGILENRTDGYDRGPTGLIHTEETRQLLSKKLKGKPRPVGSGRKKGSTHTEETKASISKTLTGRTIPAYHKGKIWVNNGLQSTMVRPPIPEGWVKGRLTFKRRWKKKP